jgi:hypothetical protein
MSEMEIIREATEALTALGGNALLDSDEGFFHFLYLPLNL